MVIEYRGDVLRRATADAREKAYQAAGKDCYLFTVNDDLVIDATMRGGIGRFTVGRPQSHHLKDHADSYARGVLCAEAAFSQTQSTPVRAVQEKCLAQRSLHVQIWAQGWVTLSADSCAPLWVFQTDCCGLSAWDAKFRSFASTLRGACS
jgi:hypothetical protein